jgi:hypothetical protein
LGAGASSSSSEALEDEGRMFRFRRLAGGAMSAEAVRNASTSVDASCESFSVVDAGFIATCRC